MIESGRYKNRTRHDVRNEVVKKDQVEAVMKRLKREHMQTLMEAACMGLHSRLGGNSIMRLLDDCTLSLVWEHLLEE